MRLITRITTTNRKSHEQAEKAVLYLLQGSGKFSWCLFIVRPAIWTICIYGVV